MSTPVRLYCWHFMSYPHLQADFDASYDSGWVTVPNHLWDSQKSRGLYQELSTSCTADALLDFLALTQQAGKRAQRG